MTRVPVLPVSLVIPTRDRPQPLREAIGSVLAGDRLPAEIVVADQSVPPCTSLPSHPDVALVHLRLAMTGLSRGRNAGVLAAGNDVLAFIDDDVIVEPDWLRTIYGALVGAQPGTAVTGAVVAAAANGYVPSFTTRTEPEVFTGRPFTDPLTPGNMAIHRSTFDVVGVFDERLGAGTTFPSAEDSDFGYRLLESGCRIAFVPQAVVHHRGARSGRDLATLDWAYGKGQGAFYAKHMSRSDGYMLRRFGRNVAYRLRRMPPALRGDRRAVREGIYLAGLCAGAIQWRWHQRRKAEPLDEGAELQRSR